MKEARKGADGCTIEHVAREEVSGQSNVLKASSMTVKTLVSAGQEPKVKSRLLFKNRLPANF